MSLKPVFPLLLLLFLQFAPAQEKKMCITVDDLPTVPYGIQDPAFQLDLTQKIVNVFANNQIPAIGYVNEGKLYENDLLDPQRVQLLELWLKNGLELGNHTRSHLNYHEVPFETYTKDLLQGEQLIKKLAKKYSSQVRYFRHPYLRSGRNKAHADSLKTFLEQNRYVEAPVTIDNEDYLFAKAYSKAYQMQDKVLMDSIGRTYVDYMEQKLLFYEGLSKELFGRYMQQTLLIHANLLNAHFLGELIKMYQAHSYSFVSQTEILTDPAYREQVSKYGDWGISWIDRWALSRGKKGDFFKGDPETPVFIKELQ